MNTDKITLGSGSLWLNGVDVGALKGVVTFTYSVDKVPFKPATIKGDTNIFRIKENAQLEASLAELKVDNLKLALGVGTSAGTNVGTSFGLTNRRQITFGGEGKQETMALRFEHTRADGKKVLVVFYKAYSDTELALPFDEENVTLFPLLFKALSDPDRDVDDRIGVLIEEL